VYIYFKDAVKPGEATDTQSDDDGFFMVDQNVDRQILGIEVLNAQSVFHEDFLRSCEQL
jgi:uncharacterized protein YuzE